MPAEPLGELAEDADADAEDITGPFLPRLDVADGSHSQAARPLLPRPPAVELLRRNVVLRAPLTMRAAALKKGIVALGVALCAVAVLVALHRRAVGGDVLKVASNLVAASEKFQLGIPHFPWSHDEEVQQPTAPSCERCPVGWCARTSHSGACHWFKSDSSYHCRIMHCNEVQQVMPQSNGVISNCWSFEGEAWYGIRDAFFPCKEETDREAKEHGKFKDTYKPRGPDRVAAEVLPVIRNEQHEQAMVQKGICNRASDLPPTRTEIIQLMELPPGKHKDGYLQMAKLCSPEFKERQAEQARKDGQKRAAHPRKLILPSHGPGRTEESHGKHDDGHHKGDAHRSSAEEDAWSCHNWTRAEKAHGDFAKEAHRKAVCEQDRKDGFKYRWYGGGTAQTCGCECCRKDRDRHREGANATDAKEEAEDLPWTCHEWEPEDQAQPKFSSHEDAACERERNDGMSYVYNFGNVSLTPGCGSCKCCKRKGINMFTPVLYDKYCNGVPIEDRQGNTPDAFTILRSKQACAEACREEDSCQYYLWKDDVAMGVKATSTSTTRYHCALFRECGTQSWYGGGGSAVIYKKSWFESTISVFVLSLDGSAGYLKTITADLKRLGITPLPLPEFGFRNASDYEAAKRSGEIPYDFNVSAASYLRLPDGVSALNRAIAHIGAVRHILTERPRTKKPLALVLEDHVVLQDNFPARMAQLLQTSTPCDWAALSLHAEEPYGECVSRDLYRVHPNSADKEEACANAVNLGSRAMLYRVEELEQLSERLKRMVWNEHLPMCLHFDRALAAISDKVPYYAVPAPAIAPASSSNEEGEKVGEKAAQEQRAMLTKAETRISSELAHDGFLLVSSLEPSTGKFNPPFTQDGADYKWFVEDRSAVLLKLEMRLNIERLKQLPQFKLIYGDESLPTGPERKHSSPVLSYSAEVSKICPHLHRGDCTFYIPLAPGPVNKLIHIRTEPVSAKGWHHQRHPHDYKIRILRPPLVHAKKLEVSAPDDAHLRFWSESNSVRSSSDVALAWNLTSRDYSIQDWGTTVNVDAECANSQLTINGRAVGEAGQHVQRITREDNIINLHCVHTHGIWSGDLAPRHTYQLSFSLATTTTTTSTRTSTTTSTSTTTTTTTPHITVATSAAVLGSCLLGVIFLLGAGSLAYLYRSTLKNSGVHHKGPNYKEPKLQRLGEDDPVFEALRLIFENVDPADLGRGRDVRDRRKYTRLAIQRVWKLDTVFEGSYEERKRPVTIQLEQIAKANFPGILGVSPTVPRVQTKVEELGQVIGVDDEFNEKILFHGTAAETAYAILHQGLNSRLSGGLFGSGVYLAEDVAKGDQYCRTGDPSSDNASLKELFKLLYANVEQGRDVFYIFVCKSMLGHPVYTQDGHTAMESPPTQTKTEPGSPIFADSSRRELVSVPNSVPPVPYHSLIAEVGDRIYRHREFIVFDGHGVLPVYLVAYRRQ